MSELTVRPLLTGFTAPSKTYFYYETLIPIYNPPDNQKAPVFCFLVEGGDKPMLVDTGLSSTEHARKYHSPFPYQPEGSSVIGLLEKLGYAPDDIGYVVLTHLHWDHCFYLSHFKKARLFAHAKEIEFANNPLPMYQRPYEHPSIGIQPPFAGLDFELIAEGDEIIPGVTIIETPGHSPGSVTACVAAASGEYLCVGDAINHMDNIKEVKELNYSISPPGRFINLIECWNSVERLKARAKSSDYLLVSHDITLVERALKNPVMR